MNTTPALQASYENLSQRFDNIETINHVQLIEAIAQDFGLTLCAAIAPEETATFWTLNQSLTLEQLNEAIEIYFLKFPGITKDLEQLKTNIHKCFGNFYKKYKDQAVIKPIMRNIAT